MLEWDDRITPEQNLSHLAGHYEGVARSLGGLPSRAKEVEELQLRAKAARGGVFLHDPGDIRGCDRKTQTWRARCAAVGMVVRPDQYYKSFQDALEPKVNNRIQVVRGSGNNALMTR